MITQVFQHHETMNTIQYFLSTLRPAPPPSARASTSGVRIESRSDDDADENPQVTEQRLAAGAARLESLLASEGQAHGETGSVAQAERGPSNYKRPADIASQGDGPAQGDADRTQITDEGPSSSVAPDRAPARFSGKDPDQRAGGIGPAGVVREDPLRDGASIKTEIARGEGIEVNAISSVAPDPPSEDSATLAAAQRTTSSSSWPWLRALARWWPIRITASMFLLLRRFITLFPLLLPGRPGYNALLAPSRPATARTSSPSLLRAPSPLSTDEEKGTREGQVISLALTTSPSPPHSAALPPAARKLSPSPSPSPTPVSIPRAPAAPPRLTPKTLVLDLDETLIHSTSRSIGLGGSGGKRGAPKGLKTRVVEVVLDGRSTVYTVYKRPWVDFFLRKVGTGDPSHSSPCQQEYSPVPFHEKVSSWYTVVIFTASLPEYADPVIDWLDGGDGRGGMVGARLFRSVSRAAPFDAF